VIFVGYWMKPLSLVSVGYKSNAVVELVDGFDLMIISLISIFIVLTNPGYCFMMIFYAN
jgi:hypothetical protein